jgi:hypothetical protein
VSFQTNANPDAASARFAASVLCFHVTRVARFIPADWRPSAFSTTGDMELWRIALSRLGTKLSVVSVFSFAGKAVLAALVYFGVLRDGDARFFALNTLSVEAAPTLLTIAFLAVYHRASLAATRVGSLGTVFIPHVMAETASESG